MDLKNQLKPHWRDWVVVNPEYARYRESADDIRVFAMDSKGARLVQSLSAIGIAQQRYALRRQISPNTRGGGGGPPAAAVQPEAEPVEQEVPRLRRSSVRIEKPINHSKFEAGKAPLRGDGPYTLKVDGTYSNGDGLILHWENLDSGLTGQSGVKSYPNRVGEPWNTELVGLQPGSIRITIRNAQGDSHHIRIEVQAETISVAEILYRPGNKTFYLLSDEEYAVLQKEAEEYDAVLRQLEQAHQSQNQDQLDGAKAQLDKKLKGLVDGKGGSSLLTEVVGFRGKKHSYVLAKTLKEIEPKHTIQDDMANRSLCGSDGKLDFKKLKEKFKPKLPNLKYEWKIIEPVAGSFNEWAEKFNARPAKIFWPADDPKRLFDASGQAQLLRYAYGLSLKSNFAFSDKTFGIKLDGGADFAAAEGKISFNGYVPNAEGHHLAFDYTVQDKNRSDFGQVKQFDLGYMRSKFELSPYGFIGASCQASAGVYFEYKPGDKETRGKVQLRGSSEGDDGFAGIGGEAFAGIKGGAEVTGSREWQNPEKKKEWATLMTVGAEGEVAGGAAAEGGFKITYHKGKFRVHAKAALVWGFGGGGGFLFTVDVKSIVEFCTFIYHQLKNKDFDFVDLLDDDAFKFYDILRLYVLLVGNPLEEVYRMGIEAFMGSEEEGKKRLREMRYAIEDALKILATAKSHMEKAKALVDRILGNPDLVLFLTPEGKGRLLRNLCYEADWGEFHNLHAQAFSVFFKTLQTRNEGKEVLEHLTSDGRRIKPKPIGGGDDDTWELGTETLREFLQKVQELGKPYQILKRFLDRLDPLDRLPKMPKLHAAAIRDNGIANV
jgi:hypothetical protein